MIPYQTFHCPKCGAPGQVNNGQAEYSCLCRLGTFQSPGTPEDLWPKCPNCGQSMFFGHSCVAVRDAVQADREVNAREG